MRKYLLIKTKYLLPFVYTILLYSSFPANLSLKEIFLLRTFRIQNLYRRRYLIITTVNRRTMKKQSIFVLVAVAAGMVFFSSCQKDLKNLKDDTRSTPLPSTTTYCRIESLLTSGGFGVAAAEWRIQYDEFENPKSIVTFDPMFG